MIAPVARKITTPAPKPMNLALPENMKIPAIPTIRAINPIATTIHPNPSLIIMILHYTRMLLVLTVRCTDVINVGEYIHYDKMNSEKAILVISFGTSYNDNREKTIGAIEKDIAEAFPDYEIRRAFTSKMIIAKLKKRDNEHIDYIDEALERLATDGFKKVIVQPTHIMNGTEYDFVRNISMNYADRFDNLTVGTPLLTTAEDYDAVVEAIDDTMIKENAPNTVILMGHGTEHYANAAYSQLMLKLLLSDKDAVVTTVEGFPSFEDTIRLLGDSDNRTVVAYPFMVVAGDHANNDMAGDEEDSLKSVLEKAGFDVECRINGLGEFPEFRKLFVEHVKKAIEGQ